jgi:hypothetical protein
MPTPPRSKEDRSQPLLKLPKNQTPALLTMHDGEEAQVFLFVAPGDRVTQVVEDTSQFVPMSFTGGTRLVARDAIAAISIHILHAPVEEELPGERQIALVRLRCGKQLRGEMRWIAPEGRRRMLDFLNTESSYFVVYDTEHVIYVAKAHVASVEEV